MMNEQEQAQQSGAMGAPGLNVPPPGQGGPGMEANGEREPNETGAPEAIKEQPVWEKAGRNEDNAVRDDNFKGKTKPDQYENKPFENKQPF